MAMDIVICGPEERKAWDFYVEHSATATMCHQFIWQPIIVRAYGHRPFYLMARREGRVHGILPLFLVSSRVFGRSLTSMPFLDYGGICADDEAVSGFLLEHALRLMQEYDAHWIELRQCEPPACAGTVSLDKVSMILDLSLGAESVWQSLAAKVRNQVRKAVKSGLSTSVGGAEFLEEFYTIFAVNMRDLGSPVHHRAFFAQMFAEFGTQARVVLVRDGQCTIGGLVGLFFKDTVVIPWASSLRQYFPKCPNNLLYWDAIQYACAQGCKHFDFGRSSVGSGTYHFKDQWGAKPLQLYWQILGRNGNDGRTLSTDNPRYQMVQAAWRRLPVPLTTLIGPHIRKYVTL
jgi:serine/alanine adding enzyme